MAVVTLKRWVLATVVDEGPQVARRTFRSKAELVACARAEYDDLFTPGDGPEDFHVDDGVTHWQLVVSGNSGWYGTEVEVDVDVSGDGALS